MKYKLSKKEIRRLGLVDIHAPTACEGRGCVVHHWSRHHMRHMPLHWRIDRGIFERTCEHGVGHPDPDQSAWFRSIGEDWRNVHGCDLCCQDHTGADKEATDA